MELATFQINKLTVKPFTFWVFLSSFQLSAYLIFLPNLGRNLSSALNFPFFFLISHPHWSLPSLQEEMFAWSVINICPSNNWEGSISQAFLPVVERRWLSHLSFPCLLILSTFIRLHVFVLFVFRGNLEKTGPLGSLALR